MEGKGISVVMIVVDIVSHMIPTLRPFMSFVTPIVCKSFSMKLIAVDLNPGASRVRH